jgi:hypothetical protein
VAANRIAAWNKLGTWILSLALNRGLDIANTIFYVVNFKLGSGVAAGVKFANHTALVLSKLFFQLGK